MAPTILVVGATGNTGKNVVEHLPKLLESSRSLSSYRIVALTRSKDSAAAQKLGKIPKVELVEQNWVEINSAWLVEHNVERVFIASHNEPNQFAEEGQFHMEALHAGVKYVVRISTTAANVHAGFRAYYPRTHWAIEQMLSQPAFDAMQWTSLQPNLFFTYTLNTAVEFIKNYKKTGKQGTLGLLIDADTPVGVIEAGDVGTLAAHLLAQDNPSKYNHARLVLNGPEDITGQQIVKMVEEKIGTKVDNVKFKATDWIDAWADGQDKQSRNVIRSIKYAPTTAWSGEAMAKTTSKEVLQLAAPQGTAKQALDVMLAE